MRDPTVQRTAKNLTIDDDRATRRPMPRLMLSADATRNNGHKGRIAVEVGDFLGWEDSVRSISLDRGQTEALSSWLIARLHVWPT